jgi:RNA polymerase sigma factor (sigma-70 family)
MATTTAPLLADLEEQYAGPRVEGCSDETLAHLVAEASEAAFAVLYERHHRALYRYCRSVVRDEADAQDALQSAWTRALVALRRGQRDAPVRPWLYRIVHNESVSLLRRRGRRTEEPPVVAADRVPSAEDHALDRERFASLLADLKELPERPRGALLMRELSGLSHEEIAAALDTSVSAAKQCIYEARRDLAELAAGRATPCDDICRRISDGDRRVLRGRRVAAHLRDCPSCAAFASAIDTRTAALHALAPWPGVIAAAAVLEVACRSGWGASAGAGVAGTTAGAGIAGPIAGAGAGTTATAAATPAAITAGVVTKAVGVPLLGKSLLAVVAVTAGIASVAGGGGAGHAGPRAAAVHTAASTPSVARAARMSSSPAAVRSTPGPAAAVSHARAARGHGAVASHRAGNHGAGNHVSRNDAAGRHGAAGYGSSMAPGQAEKETLTAPGQVKTATAPPGQARKAATTAPGQTRKTTASSSQARKPALASPGQAKKAPKTPSGQAQTDASVAPANSGTAHAK